MRWLEPEWGVAGGFRPASIRRCEQSHKLRISITKIENISDRIFKFGNVFVFEDCLKKTGKEGAARCVPIQTQAASLFCMKKSLR